MSAKFQPRLCGLSGTSFGFAAGIVFVGYVAAKYPSILLFEAIGMRRWLGSITLAWGVAASSLSFVSSEAQLYLLRTVIGAAESGLSSGIMIYLSHWAVERNRETILAIPMLSIAISQVAAGPLSGYLMGMTNPFNMPGWRWMLLVEGAPAVALGLLALSYFPDRPKEARWLTSEQQAWVEGQL